MRLRKTLARFYELAEVNAPVGGEEEHGLRALEVALDVNELHIEPVLGDLLLAYLKRFLFALFIELGNAQVVRRGDAHHRQRLHNGVVRHGVYSAAAVGKLKPL